MKNPPTTRLPGDLWNLVKQGEAATACYDLYTSINSDLVNSYAWDTAIVYIQNMGNINFANSISNSTIIANTGTLDNDVCNIFDMNGNMYEWSTENTQSSYQIGRNTYYNSGVLRGEDYVSGTAGGAKVRFTTDSGSKSNNFSFRSILFF